MSNPYKNPVLLTLDDDQRANLDLLAAQHGISRVAIIRAAIELLLVEDDDEDLWLEVARAFDGRKTTEAPGVH